MECGDEQAGGQVPHLHRFVPRRGNRPLAVPRRRHARDRTRVAFQRAQRVVLLLRVMHSSELGGFPHRLLRHRGKQLCWDALPDSYRAARCLADGL